MKNALYILVIFLFLSGITGCNHYDRSGKTLAGKANEPKVVKNASDFLEQKAFFVSSQNEESKNKVNFPLALSVTPSVPEKSLSSYFYLTNDEGKIKLVNQSFSSAVFETNITIEQILLAFEDEKTLDTNSYKGIYSFNNKKYVGMVEFNGIATEGDIDFVISIGSSKGCTSSLKGKAKLIKADKAIYQDSLSGCSLDFVFNDNKLQIKENNCRLFHGPSCEFKGNFDKE